MKNHNKHYQQLTREERYQISGLRKAGMTQTDIAQIVGFCKSTISRELKRNSTENDYYPKVAHVQSVNQRRSQDFGPPLKFTCQQFLNMLN